MTNANQTFLSSIVATRLTMNYCNGLTDIARQKNTTVAALIRQVLMEWIDKNEEIPAIDYWHFDS
ncbi:hypothetical protein [Aphanizomenon flos-aquae]|jgi:hypothetical protein|uniref:Ribbon-helix-helix protein CopG domain-containing protein n=1 Tax=Aphanizomenon flos-aquae FACHB-1040 TaxID=2692887 RepID=A0ABR8C017_APHFL|nr:hypothetical protein [Aphanizomenon flos-aquae]MBD2280065.1 hypothetical protein [Aphanizomenon flos-aquae FACHB-1040]